MLIIIRLVLNTKNPISLINNSKTLHFFPISINPFKKRLLPIFLRNTYQINPQKTMRNQDAVFLKSSLQSLFNTCNIFHILNTIECRCFIVFIYRQTTTKIFKFIVTFLFHPLFQESICLLNEISTFII